MTEPDVATGNHMSILSPYQIGDLRLANRMVMAPMSRARCPSPITCREPLQV
jgi:2,4-dienoyl-CoA reductase-like NADH-dependent reductase (Old Yellow Enzyme family)